MFPLSEKSRQKILKMCREQLTRPNPPNTKALYGRALRIDEGVRDLSLRQFHAKFPLQVKRELARAEEKENAQALEPEPRENGEDISALRDRIATLLLAFGREAARASNFEEISRLVDRADAYVDRIVRAQGE